MVARTRFDVMLYVHCLYWGGEVLKQYLEDGCASAIS
jgi:hypothetical protein